MSFLRFFVRQTVLVNLLAAFIVTVGAYTALNTRREAFPAVSFDLVTVVTAYPGASPEETEKLVTLPLEKELETVDGIKQMDSVSVENISTVILKIDPDAPNKDRVVMDIQSAVDRVADLPEDAEDPVVTEIKPHFPVLTVSVGSKELSPLELRRFVKKLQDDLEDIPGVSEAAASGLLDEEIWVELDSKRLDETAVSVAQVAEALRRWNVQLPGGRLKANGKEVLVRVGKQFETAKDIEKVWVRSNDEGAGVRVGEIGRVTHRLEEARQIYRVNGKPAIALLVQKKPSGDSLKIADQAKAHIARLAKEHPQIEFAVSDDSTFYIKRRLGVALNNAAIGFVLVVAVLFLLLSPHAAVFTAAGMVVALLAGILLARAFGMTVNLLTLFGFVMVLGMLVDDSVVVAESIDRLQEEGKNPSEDAVRGAARVAAPVLSSVTTTIAAFLPLVFMSGILGKFMKFIPAVVIFCLIASLLEAFLILPNHLAHMFRWRTFSWFRKIETFQENHVLPRFSALQEKVLRLLGVFVRRPWRTFGGFTVFLVVVFLAVGSQLRFKLFPVDIDEFNLSWEMPVGTALEETDRVGLEMEKIVAQLPKEEVDVFLTTIGGKGEVDQFTRGTHLGQIRVVLVQPHLRKRTGEEIENQIREEAKKVVGPLHVEVSGRRTGPPTGKPISVVLMGDDLNLLRELSRKLQAYLRGRPGVLDVGDNDEPGKEEKQILVNEKTASRAGVSTAQVTAAVRGALDGLEVDKIRRGTEEITLRVRFFEKESRDPKVFSKVFVTTPTGNKVALSNLVTFEKTRGPLQILRRDGKRAITVEAEVDEKITTAYAENRILQEKVLPEMFRNVTGASYKVVGENEDTQESLASLKKLFIVALLLIYIILATQFSSFSQPFLIMFSIPLGIAGVLLILFVHGMPISLLALLGVVALSGVVVNNAILLLEFANRAYEQGASPVEAALEAGRQRFRAILITSFTTVAGILPLGYGIGGEEPFLAPMALVLGWGLAISTILTFFSVPAIWILWRKVVGARPHNS